MRNKIYSGVWSMTNGNINCRFIKPIDDILLMELLNNHKYFVSIEEGIISGGFGSSIIEYFNKNNINKQIHIMGINDEFTTHGDRESLLKLCNLDVNSIIEKIKSLIDE